MTPETSVVSGIS